MAALISDDLPATVGDRSDMVFYSKPVNGGSRFSELLKLWKRLGGPDLETRPAPPLDLDALAEWIELNGGEQPDDADRLATIWRILSEKHDCTIVHDQFYGIQFSNFVDDEAATLFRLKYL